MLFLLNALVDGFALSGFFSELVGDILALTLELVDFPIEAFAFGRLLPDFAGKDATVPFVLVALFLVYLSNFFVVQSFFPLDERLGLLTLLLFLME